MLNGFCFTTEKIITDHDVEGIPILMLANKQDHPNSLKVEEIKEIFSKIALKLGARDSRVLPISALQGFVFFHNCISLIDQLSTF
jgi:ADP-ribosylation factor related protein 1